MRLYITGADGMLGSALRAVLAADPATAEWTVHGVSISDFDVGDREAVMKDVEAFGPDVVIHAAAHAIVDDCEADPKLALRVNVGGVRNVAAACRRNAARLVYVSSDYVFDGTSPPSDGYREDDTPYPRNVYGLTKLAGERISAMVQRHLIVRTSWLFGGADERTDVVLGALRRARRGEPVKLIDDQFSRPTYTVDLARAMVFLLRRGTTGTIHVASTGSASWYEVARVTLTGDGGPAGGSVAVAPIALEDCGFLADRPRDSTLSTARLERLGYAMPTWADAVGRFRLALFGSGGHG